MREGGRAGGRADEPAHTLTLSLSLANTCNPYCKRIPPWRRITRAAVLPPCVPSRANPSGLWHVATILLVGPGTPPGVETPTDSNTNIHKKTIVAHFI
jgi:hypothetical protein